MNSQRCRPGPIKTQVVGRAGSQIWRFTSGSRAPGARNGVDDEPGLVELEIVESAPDRLAHRARGAVAADDVAGVHAERTVRPRDLDGHPAGLGAEPLEGSAEQHAGMRRALRAWRAARAPGRAG